MCILTVKEGGDTPEWKRAIEHGMLTGEGGEPLNQEEEDGSPPEKHELPAHGMQERRKGGRGANPEETNGVPPE